MTVNFLYTYSTNGTKLNDIREFNQRKKNSGKNIELNDRQKKSNRILMREKEKDESKQKKNTRIYSS